MRELELEGSRLAEQSMRQSSPVRKSYKPKLPVGRKFTENEKLKKKPKKVTNGWLTKTLLCNCVYD